MRTVVVCSNCHFVWVVKDRPKTSKCRKCGKSHQFKSLLKFFQGEDEEAVRLARAHAQAKVNGREDMFEKEFDKGVLEQEVDQIISESEYLSEKGIDVEQIDTTVEKLLASPEGDRSHRVIIKDAIRKQNKPDLDDFINYVEERGIDAETAVLKLEKLLLTGKIAPPDRFSLNDVESRASSYLNSSAEIGGESSPGRNDPSEDSYLGIIKEALEKHNNGPVSAIIAFAEERGVPRDSAALYLEKLVRSENVHLKIPLAEIAEETEKELGLQNGQDEGESSEPPSQESRLQIVKNGLEEFSDPMLDDVIEYTTDRGLSEGQTLSALEELISSGHTTGLQNIDIESVRKRRRPDSGGTSDSDIDFSPSLNQREMVLKLVRQFDEPNEEDVLEAAKKHGISKERTQTILKKLIRNGKVSRKPDNSLRTL